MTKDERIIYESIQCWKNEALVGVTVTTYFLIDTARKIAMKLFSNSERACRGLRGSDHDECILKYKEMSMKELVKSLTDIRRRCVETKNPEDCRDKINNKIEKVRAKLLKYQNKLRGF